MDNTSILSGESENVYDEKITSDDDYLSCESEEAKEDDCLVTRAMLRKIRTKTDELRELIVEAEKCLTSPHVNLGELIDHNELKDVGTHLSSMSRSVEASNEILTRKVLKKNIADLTDRLKKSNTGTFDRCNALALNRFKSEYEKFKQDIEEKKNRATILAGTQTEAETVEYSPEVFNKPENEAQSANTSSSEKRKIGQPEHTSTSPVQDGSQSDVIDTEKNRFNRHEIYIGNLRQFITKYQIGDHFQQYGNVEDVFLIQSGYKRNYGFVAFENAESVKRVFDDLVCLL